MGRAINDRNTLDDHERRLKLLEDALEEMIQTRVHHVDINDELDKNVRMAEHERVMREESTPPTGKRKKTRKTAKTEEPKRVESLL